MTSTLLTVTPYPLLMQNPPEKDLLTPNRHDVMNTVAKSPNKRKQRDGVIGGFRRRASCGNQTIVLLS